MDTSNSCAAATVGTALLVSMLAATAGAAQALALARMWSGHAATIALQSSMRAGNTLAAWLVGCGHIVGLCCVSPTPPKPVPITATVMSLKQLYAA